MSQVEYQSTSDYKNEIRGNQESLNIYKLKSHIVSQSLTFTTTKSCNTKYIADIHTGDGKILLAGHLTDNEEYVDVSALQNGIYYVVLRSEKGEYISTEKFIKA